MLNNKEKIQTHIHGRKQEERIIVRMSSVVNRHTYSAIFYVTIVVSRMLHE